MRSKLYHIRELKTRWQIRFRDGSRHPKEVHFSFPKHQYAERDVIEKRDELYVAWRTGWDPWSGVLPGENEINRPVKLITAIEDFCHSKRLRGQRGQRGGWASQANYKRNLTLLRKFADMTGQNRLVDDVRTKDFEDFIFQEHLADETSAMYRRLLATFRSFLLDEGFLVAPLPEPMKRRRTIKPYVTEEEMHALCRAHERLCREKLYKKHAPKSGPNTGLARLWMVDAFRIFFYQGLRLRELTQLRRGAVDLHRAVMRIGDEAFVPKGGDEAVIAITEPARPIIERYCAGKPPGERLFPYNSPQRITKALRVAAAEAGLDKGSVTAQMLRRSCGYYWAARGMTPWDVKSLLRHKSVTTTEQYYVQHVVEGQRRRFEAAFRGEIKPGRLANHELLG